MKRYIKSSEDYYFVKEIWRYRNLATGNMVESEGYLGEDGQWYNATKAKKFSKSAAQSRVRRLNAKNTDSSLSYTIEKYGS